MSRPSGSQPTHPAEIPSFLHINGYISIDKWVRIPPAELVGWSVISYSRFKRLDGSEHEYVDFKVVHKDYHKDSDGDPGRGVMYLAIERSAQDGSALIQKIAGTLEAEDTISFWDPRATDFPIDPLITFEEDFPFRDLITLTKAIHNSAPLYSLCGTQCYWFADALVQGLQCTYRTKKEEEKSDMKHALRQGTYKHVPIEEITEVERSHIADMFIAALADGDQNDVVAGGNNAVAGGSNAVAGGSYAAAGGIADNAAAGGIAGNAAAGGIAGNAAAGGITNNAVAGAWRERCSSLWKLWKLYTGSREQCSAHRKHCSGRRGGAGLLFLHLKLHSPDLLL